MPATIKDIAKRLNISVSTVSYALNDGPRSVPEEVKRKVLEVAEELDYRPNRLARSLITRRSHIIGVVPLDATAHDIMLGSYVQRVLNGVLNAAQESDQNVLIVTKCDTSDTQGTVKRLLDGHIDGLVFITGYLMEPILKELSSRKFPHVVLSSVAKGSPSLCVDNRGGSEQVMQHLYDLGHRKIGHLEGIPSHFDAKERYQAYLSFMRDHHLPVKPHWVACGMFHPVLAIQAVRAVLEHEDRPTALFAANDEMAITAVTVAREMGVRVPEDLSIVGFDNAPESSICYPSLTTVQHPEIEMGEMAVRVVLDQIADKPLSNHMRFSTRLIVRSTTTRPTEDLNNHA